MDVQLRASSMLVVLIDLTWKGRGSPVYWATMQADTCLKTSEL